MKKIMLCIFFFTMPIFTQDCIQNQRVQQKVPKKQRLLRAKLLNPTSKALIKSECDQAGCPHGCPETKWTPYRWSPRGLWGPSVDLQTFGRHRGSGGFIFGFDGW